jgi:lysophospholipase L1-like esterase
VRVAASLGDSFPAGAGAAGMEGPCLRSPKAWPELLAESTGMSMTNLACSGAKIEDFYEQLPELPADVSVVFLQGGGNSIGFREVLGDCLASGCRDYQEITRGRLALVRSEMASFLREVHAVRPGVDEIVFVGYPPSTADGVLCEGIGANLASLMESGTRDLNAVLRAAVEDAALSGVPARFVDVSSLTGHPVCADDPWFHGPERGLLLLHPNDAGHRALADAVAATVLSTTAKVPSG